MINTSAETALIFMQTLEPKKKLKLNNPHYLIKINFHNDLVSHLRSKVLRRLTLGPILLAVGKD